MVTAPSHSLLEAAAFVTHFPAPLGALTTPSPVQELLRGAGDPRLRSSDAVRAAVRDLLRLGGYKPTGRGKPSSEYLLRAAADGTLGAINAAVDVGNAVSLHSGLPISVVDVRRASPPFFVEIAPPGESYVFNASGQEIALDGLLCLFDGDGPIANAVKDAQRTKTLPSTETTLTIVWGTKSLPGRGNEAAAWCQDLLSALAVRMEEA